MSALRTVVSRISMLAGAVLVVVGIGIRLGVLAVPGAAGEAGTPDPSARGQAVVAVASAAPSPTPSAQVVTASAEPARTPRPDPSPAGSPWFLDEFEAVAAWPDGQLDALTTSVRGGTYRTEADATDLPVYLFAAAGDGAPTPPLAVAAELVLGPGDPGSAAGIALEAADGTRLAALVSGAGRVTLVRDSFVQLDELAAGSIHPPAGVVRLRLLLDGETVTVTIDDVVVARAREPFEPIAAGLAVWARGRSRVEVLRFEVRLDVRA